MSDSRDTPAMRQYRRFKTLHPGCVLLFRMGDFYESFDEDAVTLHKALGLTLTERTAGIPMAGVPHHQLETYLKRLSVMGFRIAVADQIQDPKDAKGIVERAVTRVVTPGTLTDEALLIESGSSRLAAASVAGREPGLRIGMAVLDLSTGEFVLVETPAEGFGDELSRQSVREVLVPELFNADAPKVLSEAAQKAGAAVTTRPAWHFRQSEAIEALLGQFGVATVAGFGVDASDACLGPAGAVIRYLIETQAADLEGDATKPGMLPRRRATLAHLRPPRRLDPGQYCIIDGTSLRALEVERTMRPGIGEGGGDRSLIGLFLAKDCAPRTPMGKRLIGEWIRRPLAQREAIEARLAGVAAMAEDRTMAAAAGAALGEIQDIPRIAARVALARASPRDLMALATSIAAIPAVIECVSSTPALAASVSALGEAHGALAEFATRVTTMCVESPPGHAREGGVIRDGVDADLDEARLLCRDAGAWLAEYQRTLLEKHKLPGIKVGYNKVFGYYIELTAAQATSAPAEFTRKQTLKNAERYITPELRDFEDRVTTAEARAIERERTLFDILCDQAAELLSPMNAAGDALAALDATWGFAQRAARSQWVRPVLADAPVLSLRDSRHPVLSEILRDRFVPNDLDLGIEGGEEDAATLALITGPNMAGKSTFIRQVALVVLLAHAGSFVPAGAATVGLTDRIFTRVGADDALHAGQSTFMVEMTETATILNNCTSRSVVVLDEIGRGTSTLDGLSLAWAIAERLASGLRDQRGPRTLFATHYHEITALQEELPDRVRNLRVEVREWPAGDPAAQIVFLHRISPGRSDQSYGLHVARLAGVPEAVVARARRILHSLEVQHRTADTHEGGGDAATSPRIRTRAAVPQLPLFAGVEPHPVIEELKRMNLDALTPLEAFDALRRMRTMTDDARD